MKLKLAHKLEMELSVELESGLLSFVTQIFFLVNYSSYVDVLIFFFKIFDWIPWSTLVVHYYRTYDE